MKNNIEDIFIIGSSLKNKKFPNDLDLVVLFKDKSKNKEIQEILFEIKENLDFVDNVHLEPFFIEDLFSETLLLTILNEGYSIKNKKYIYEDLHVESFIMYSYTLSNLDKVQKVRFAQALYGRKKDGLLYSEKGISIAFGSIMVPIHREEIFKDFFKKWKVKFSRKKVFVSD